MYNCVKITLMQLIEEGEKKFIIYPYGKIGHMVEEALKEMGIQSIVSMDDRSEAADIFGIETITDPHVYKDYVVIIATQYDFWWKQKRDNAKKYLPNNRIVSMFNYDDDDLRENIVKRRNFDVARNIYTLKSEGSPGGVYMYLPMWKTDSIQGNIVLNDRFFEDIYLSYVQKKFGEKIKGRSVIDIGANIGNHSLYFASEMKARKVYAFEPIKENYDILRRNIELNALNIVPYNLALGDNHARGKRIQWSLYIMGGAEIKESNEDGEFDICTLDEINIEDDIALIKIDVEGFEQKVINGAMKTIEKNHPILMIEIFDEFNNFWPIYNALHGLGYQVESHSTIDFIFY